VSPHPPEGHLVSLTPPTPPSPYHFGRTVCLFLMGYRAMLLVSILGTPTRGPRTLQCSVYALRSQTIVSCIKLSVIIPNVARGELPGPDVIGQRNTDNPEAPNTSNSLGA
jgi:hypothetical protein